MPRNILPWHRAGAGTGTSTSTVATELRHLSVVVLEACAKCTPELAGGTLMRLLKSQQDAAIPPPQDLGEALVAGVCAAIRHGAVQLLPQV